MRILGETSTSPCSKKQMGTSEVVPMVRMVLTSGSEEVNRGAL